MFHLTGVRDLDEYILSEYFDYRDAHICCQLSKHIYKCVIKRMKWIKRNDNLPAGGLDFNIISKIDRMYTNSRVYNVYNLIFVRSSSYLNLNYFRYNTRNKLTYAKLNIHEHVLYSTNNIFKIKPDYNNVFSLFIK
jgi:hypothetical protein